MKKIFLDLVRKLLFPEALRISEFFSSNSVGVDDLLNLVATFDGPIPRIEAGGSMHIKVALKIIGEMDEEHVPSSCKSQLIETITKARKSSDWGTRPRVLLVWESGIAFQLMKIRLTCLAGRN